MTFFVVIKKYLSLCLNKRLGRLNGDRLNEVFNSCTARLDKRSSIAKIHQTLFSLLFLQAKLVIVPEKMEDKESIVPTLVNLTPGVSITSFNQVLANQGPTSSLVNQASL